MPAIGHRRKEKSMIKEKGNTLPAKENQERRQFGHLCLLVSEAQRVGIRPRKGLSNLKREERAPTTIMSESVMPKRQPNRVYRESETPGAEITGPGVNHECADNPSIKREFMLTPLADESLHDAVRVLSRATGTSLSNSHFLRVVLKVIEHAMPQIQSEALRLGKLKRPSNARENQAQREEYEQKMAEALGAALRSCPPLGSDTGAAGKGRETAKRPPAGTGH
jgi:hypothetical protein